MRRRRVDLRSSSSSSSSMPDAPFNTGVLDADIFAGQFVECFQQRSALRSGNGFRRCACFDVRWQVRPRRAWLSARIAGSVRPAFSSDRCASALNATPQPPQRTLPAACFRTCAVTRNATSHSGHWVYIAQPSILRPVSRAQICPPCSLNCGSSNSIQGR